MNTNVFNIIIASFLFCVFNEAVISVYGEEEISNSTQEISLSLLKPSFSWTITSNKTSYSVGVYTIPSLQRDFEEDNVKISLIIEEMSCNQQSQEEIFLSIDGDFGTSEFCANVNNRKNNFRAVREVFDKEEEIDITPVGNWNNTQARLFVSVYIEKESCEKCPPNFFCCGTPLSACAIEEMPSELKTNGSIENVRCIPKTETSTFCNGHPNCGFYCNSDELPSVCTKIMNFSDYEIVIGNSSEEKVETVWLAVLFLAAVLVILATVMILISFCNSLDQKGILGNTCTNLRSRPKQSKISLNKCQKTPIVVSSFRYNEEYL